MNKINVTAFICVGIVAAWQMVALSQSGAAPQIAFDIPKIDVDTHVLSGSGVLTTGGTMTDKKPSPNYNILNGPGGDGTPGTGAYSRRLQAGVIVIIPPGVLHVRTEIPDQVTYLSVRPDPDRVLPGGYVNPLLLKNQPAAAK